MKRLRRALQRILLGRSPWTVLVAIIALSVIFSLVVRYIVYLLGISADSIESLANSLGYLGGLAFFVPVIVAMTLDFKSRKLGEIVGTINEGEAKVKLQDIQNGTRNFMNKLKSKVEIYNTIGFILVTLAFFLGI